MNLARIEKETIVSFNDEYPCATIYTCNASLSKKLRTLSEKFPSESILTRQDENSITCTVPKSWVKVKPPRFMSDDQKAKAAERLTSNLRRETPTVVGGTENIQAPKGSFTF